MDVYLTSLAIGGLGLVAMVVGGSGRHGKDHSHTSVAHSDAQSDAHGAAHHALALLSPRIFFSFCLGLGATGIILRGVAPEPALTIIAIVGGIAFERFIVAPIWNLVFRFASAPALTLESALMSEATAVTRFDANGQGLIAIEVDGHVVQLLGTLDSNNRATKAQVLAGARLRVEDVDATRNRCTVSLI